MCKNTRALVGNTKTTTTMTPKIQKADYNINGKPLITRKNEGKTKKIPKQIYQNKTLEISVTVDPEVYKTVKVNMTKV